MIKILLISVRYEEFLLLYYGDPEMSVLPLCAAKNKKIRSSPGVPLFFYHMPSKYPA